MPRFAGLFALLVGAVASPLTAQGPDIPLQSRIRLKQGPGSSWVSGTLIRSSADSLYLASENRETAVARDRITRLDISRGRKPNTLGGLKNGAIVGGAIGTVLGLMVLAYEDDSWFDYGAEVVPISMAGCTVLGAVLGTGFGTLLRTDRWERVETQGPALAVIVSPGPNGARLGLSAHF